MRGDLSPVTVRVSTVLAQSRPRPVNMRNKWSWSRPAAHIYSYNTDPTTFRTGYSYSSSSSGERSARASSVALGSECGVSRTSRALTVAPASATSDLSGYSGYYGRQLAQHSDKAAVTTSSRATRAVSTAVTEQTSKSVEQSEKTSRRTDFMKEHSQSLEYGKSSRCQALRRAEMHAEKSGRDPRHVMVPRNLDDDICKQVSQEIKVSLFLCSFIILISF